MNLVFEETHVGYLVRLEREVTDFWNRLRYVRINFCSLWDCGRFGSERSERVDSTFPVARRISSTQLRDKVIIDMVSRKRMCSYYWNFSETRSVRMRHEDDKVRFLLHIQR